MDKAVVYVCFCTWVRGDLLNISRVLEILLVLLYWYNVNVLKISHRGTGKSALLKGNCRVN